MKKSFNKIIHSGKNSLDIELLRHWQKISTKGRLNWLVDALYFGKLKKFE